MKCGERVAPRGQETREDLDVVMIVDKPWDALLSGIGRNLNTALASLEALQLIAGTSDPALMKKVAPNTGRFIDGGQFHGAYGPRTASQMSTAIDRLRKDPDTRQAIVSVWDPLHDLFIEGRKDYPCTIMMQFLIRNDRLVMHTTMRSNDLWWGLSYDMFMFTQLQLAVANALGIEPGPYHHHSISMHFYERDRAAIAACIDQGALSRAHARVDGIGYPDGGYWSEISETARRIIYGESFEAYGGAHWHNAQAARWRSDDA